MKIRVLFIILIIFLTSLSASAKQTIVFWYGATQEEQIAYKEMVSRFEKANPDIKVNAMLVPQKYVERKLILSIAGGVPPDVVRFYAHLGGELMSRTALEPLDDLIKRDNYDITDFYKVGLIQNSYKDKLYGIPWVLTPNALFYNKTLFKKAGFNPNKPPANWNELEVYAKKLTKLDKNGNISQVGFDGFLYNPNNFALYTWQSGGDIISKNNKAVFNSKIGISALTWMRDFLKDEVGSVNKLMVFSSNYKGATQDPFGLGLVGMRIDGPYRIPDLKKYFPNLDYGVAAIPYSKMQTSEVVGNSLVIPRGSKHKEAAWKFIKFAASSKELELMFKGRGRIPARISTAKSPAFYSDKIMKVFIDQIPHGKSIPVAAGWQEASDKLAREIEKALKGDKSPADALNNAAKSVDNIIINANENMSAYKKISWLKAAIISIIILFAVILYFILLVKKGTAHSKIERSEAKTFYLFAAPWIIGFVLLTFGSIAASLILSFSKWDAITPAHFVGFKNYIQLFKSDPRFLKAVSVTAYYAVFSIPLAMVGGLAVSVLMNQKLFGIRLFRTIYYIPVVISGVATSILWIYMFNPNGLINKFLTSSIIPAIIDGKFAFIPIWANPPQWLLDPHFAMPAFIIMGIWGVGGAMVVYLAALQGVPEELYESARIDGASSWKQFRHVALPLLTPAIFYQLVVGTMYALQMFTQAYLMTGGGPDDSTLFYGLYLFKNAFEWMKMGYASAMAWILFLVVLFITAIHFTMAKRWVYYEGQREK